MGLLNLFNKGKKIATSKGSGSNKGRSSYGKKGYIQKDTTPICPYCKAKGVLDARKWSCPTCEDVSVGVYNGSTRPLGIMADARTRQWRVFVHDELAYKWEFGQSKDEFYGWIANTLNRGNKPSTIANLNMEECQKLIREGRKEHYELRYKEIFEHK